MSSNIKIANSDPKISLCWDDVFDVITDGGTHGIASLWGKIPSVADAASIISKARKSVKLTIPLESEAFRLIILCFASAIDELRPTDAHPDLLASARKTVSKAKILINEKDYFLERKFFNNPISLPLYQDLRTTFISGLSILWPRVGDIGGKLDRSFNSALYKIVRRERDLVANLLAITDGPGATADELERDWAAYRNALSHAFHVKPVFGQEETHISLSQIYVPPRADFVNTVEKDGKPETELHLVDLTKNMIGWIEDQDPSRCIRLVRGGPGSGKSSFSRSICAYLAENENYRPIFIELQRLPFGSNLAERVSGLLIDREENFRHNPLRKETLDSKRPTILVFDGLDELVVPKSQGVQKIAEDFWDELDDLLASLNTNEKIRVKALITGREPIMQAAQSTRRGRKLDRRDALRIIGLGEQSGRYKSVSGCSADDQRALWWKTYATATGARIDTPPILTDEKLSTLTSEPLLCYLIALSGKAEESHENEVTNINDVYEKLIQDVWLRVWGTVPAASHNMNEELKAEHRRVGPVGVFDTQNEFERMLEYISIAAWRGGESRTATLNEFNDAVRETEVEEIWRKFQKSFSQSDADENFSTLALTFFFKEGEGDGKGFEFTHRSFGEYLTARTLWRYWDDNSSRLSRIRRIDELYDWVQLTTSATITDEILSFLKNEFLRKSVEDLRFYRACLIKCFTLVLKDGFLIRLGDTECWRDAERKQRNAEGTMFCCLSAVSVALMRKNEEEGAVCVGLNKDRLGRTFLNRIGVTDESISTGARLEGGRTSIYRQALAGINFASESLNAPDISHESHQRNVRSNCDYDILRIFQSDLSFSDFSGAHLRASGLSLSKMHRTSFLNARLDHCIAIGCDFTSAFIDGASFVAARLISSNFSNLTLNNISFADADLTECDFSSCTFNSVDFSRAIIEASNFSGADLSNATGLTQSRINKASGNISTILPSGLKLPQKWQANGSSTNLIEKA